MASQSNLEYICEASESQRWTRRMPSAESPPQARHFLRLLVVFIFIATSERGLALGVDERVGSASPYEIRNVGDQTKRKIHTFNLPPQPMESALLAFAEQAKVQILFDANLVNLLSTTSVPLVGDIRLVDALERLIHRAALEYVFTSATTIVIREKNAPSINLHRGSIQTNSSPVDSVDETLVTHDRLLRSLTFDEMISTGSGRPQPLLETSSSMTTVDQRLAVNFAPRSTAEFLRVISGINVQGSAGSGNANITVRGLPFPTNGGTRFLLIQEDGLPVLQYGDINFGNEDIYVRFDYSVEKAEVLKNGSATTFASNSPAGIINFINKTGEKKERRIGLTSGLDFQSNQLNFGFGSPLNQSLRFHLGGYLREGDGVRHAGYTANSGGQIKLNVTQDFGKSSLRFFVKKLDDKTIDYFPMPQGKDGRSLDDFDALSDSQHSKHLGHNSGISADGEIFTSDVSDGLHADMVSLGLQAEIQWNDQWVIDNKYRNNTVKGRAVTPFTANIDLAGNLADNFYGQSNTQIAFATGANKGEVFDRSRLAQLIHLFDVDIQDFGGYANDLRVSRETDFHSLTFGYYRALQKIRSDWVWSSYLMEVRGRNAHLLDVSNSAGDTALTSNGIAAFGAPAWGEDCCQRFYNQKSDINSVYFHFLYDTEMLNLDASIRYEFGKSYGDYAGVAQFDAVDVDGNGSIVGAERRVPIVDKNRSSKIDFDWGDYSYALGANIKFNADAAIFSHISRGIRVGADRELFDGGIRNNGSIDNDLLIDEISNIELGARLQNASLSLSATAFSSATRISNVDITKTPNAVVDSEYVAEGVEIEGAWNIDSLGFCGKRRCSFDFNWSVTWMDAKVKRDRLNEDNNGNDIQSQPDMTWKLRPTLQFSNIDLGLIFVGQGDAAGDRENTFETSGFTTTNAFLNWRVNSEITASLNVTNALNERGVTEVTSRHWVDNEELWAARSYPGRSTSLSLVWDF